jgi:acetolactate synthase-1/2/3 large subunit
MESPGGFKPTHELVMPTADDLTEVLNVLGDYHWGEAEIAAWRERIRDRVLADERQAGNAFRVVEQTLRNRSFEPRIVLDTGFFCTVGETIWRCRQPGDYVGSAVGRYMGVSIPGAIGLSISQRDQPVVCAAGDGGIGSAIGELRLAVTEKLPLLVLCFSDGGYGSVAAYATRNPAIQRATEFTDAPWWKVAAGLGMDSAMVSTPGGLSGQIEGWNPLDGPLFLQLAFDPAAYRDIARRLR